MARRSLLFFVAVSIVLVVWTNLRLGTSIVSQQESVSPSLGRPAFGQQGGARNIGVETQASIALQPSHAAAPYKNSGNTKMLGFADGNYVEYAMRWYRRLEALGYTEQVVVAVDQEAVKFFQSLTISNSTVRWEALPYPPCIKMKKDKRLFRRQLFGRRWKYVYEQLQAGHSILIADVDNVFTRFVPMRRFEESDYDVFHAYSTSYPTYVFESMGMTVCGGMAWLRADPRVIRFVGSLVNQCKCSGDDKEKLCKACQCDDQVVLNELLWKGKHQVQWSRSLPKVKSLKDYQWDAIEGVSNKTKHRIYVWDRNFAYRAPMPDKCPKKNWVAMPLYVDRDVVVERWDKLCANSSGPSPVVD